MRSFWSLYFLRKSLVRRKTCWDVGLLDLSFFFCFSIPRAPSRSSHYVGKVGGYNRVLICTLNPPNGSPWIETCPFSSIRVDPPSPITPSYWTICCICAIEGSARTLRFCFWRSLCFGFNLRFCIWFHSSPIHHPLVKQKVFHISQMLRLWVMTHGISLCLSLYVSLFECIV